MNYYLTLLLFLVTCSISGLFAQIDESKRYDEVAIEQETRFVTAAQLQLLARYDEAIAMYKDIIKKDGEKAIVYFQMSRCYEANSDIAKAIDNAKKATDLDRNNEYFALQLAEVYEANQAFSNAADTYLDYAKKHTDQPFFFERAVFFYIKSQEYDRALAVLDRMEKINGIEEDVSRQKFEIYSKRGEQKKATKQLQKLVKAYPKKEKYKLNLANYYLKMGQMSKAKDIFRDILKKDPSNKTALRYMDLSNAPASNDEVNYLKAVSADISNLSITLDQKIAKILPSLKSLTKIHNTELNEQLILVAKELCEVYPDEAKPKAILGDAYMQNKEYNEAISAYKATLKRNGSVFEVWHQLMLAQKELEDYKDLLISSDKALMRFPNQGLTYLFNGFAYNKTNNPSEAVEIINEGLLISSSDASLKNMLNVELARSKYLMQEYDRALGILDKELISSADSWELHGDILIQQGKTDAAIVSWKKALKIEPKNDRVSKKISQKQI